MQPDKETRATEVIARRRRTWRCARRLTAQSGLQIRGHFGECFVPIHKVGVSA